MSIVTRLALSLWLLAASGPTASRVDRLESLARPARGRVGVGIELLETGERYALHGGERFPMQSAYKLPIGMAVLHAVDEGRLALDRKVRVTKADLVPEPLGSPLREAHPQGEVDLTVDALMDLMMTRSDGTASDVLLRLVGGPERVTAYLRTLGVDGVVVATSELEMSRGEEVQYRNWATPDSMLVLLRAVQEGRGLSKASRARLLALMTGSLTGVHRLKGRLPAGTVVAHKTGTSRTVGGLTRATNDVGIVTLPDGRHVAIAVFVSDSPADEATREGVIAAVAREAWDWWTAGWR